MNSHNFTVDLEKSHPPQFRKLLSQTEGLVSLHISPVLLALEDSLLLPIDGDRTLSSTAISSGSMIPLGLTSETNPSDGTTKNRP